MDQEGEGEIERGSREQGGFHQTVSELLTQFCTHPRPQITWVLHNTKSITIHRQIISPYTTK